jgi:hypothetical protein
MIVTKDREIGFFFESIIPYNINTFEKYFKISSWFYCIQTNFKNLVTFCANLTLKLFICSSLVLVGEIVLSFFL